MKKVFPVSLDEGMIEWIKDEVKRGQFRNRSHVVEFILESYRKQLLQKYDTAKLREFEQRIKQMKGVKEEEDEKSVSREP